MSWNNMYNQGNFGGRAHGNFRGGFNPQLNSPGGYGRGGNNFRGGFRQGHDLYVNDEVVGGGGGGGGYQRKAPPAHSGNNFSNYGGQPGPMFNPPQAHSYGGFPGYGHYGYGGYQNWNDYNQGYGAQANRRTQPQHRPSSEEERHGEHKEKEEVMHSADPVEDSGLETLPKKTPEKEEAPIPMIRSQEKGESDSQSSKDSGNGQTSGSTNSRRKQYTPQKVPVGPGGGTMNIITQKGLILENESESSISQSSPSAAVKDLSNELNTEEKKETNVSDSEENKNEGKKDQQEIRSPPGKREASKMVAKKEEIKNDNDLEEANSNKVRRPVAESQTTPETEKGLEPLKRDEKVTSSEEDKAEKESDEDDSKNKQIARKKRAARSESKVEETDSDLDAAVGASPTKISPTKTRFTSPRTTKSSGAPAQDTTPTKSSKDDKLLENPLLPQLRAEDTPQRRRSKGEMKEFPIDASPKVPKPVLTHDVPQEEKETQKKSSEFETPRRGGRRKETKTPSPNMRKETFKRVEEDLEAMFAGLATPVHQSEEREAFQLSEPERKSPRSKRKSAQTAELKIRENQSEDAFQMYQPESIPKSVKESPTASKEPTKKQKSQPEPAKLEEKPVESKNKRSSTGSKNEPAVKPSTKTTQTLVLVDETAPTEDTEGTANKDNAATDTTLTTPTKRTRRSKGSTSGTDSKQVKEAENNEVKPSPAKSVTPEVRSSRRRALSTQSSEDSPAPTTKKAKKAESQQEPSSPVPPTPGLRSSGRRREKATSQEILKNENQEMDTPEKLPKKTAKEVPDHPEERVPEPTQEKQPEPPQEPVQESSKVPDKEKDAGPVSDPAPAKISKRQSTSDRKDSADDVPTPAKKKAVGPKSKAVKEDKAKKNKKSFEDIPDPKGKKPSKAKSDWKGPYVYIEGDFRSPRTVRVVNSEVTDGNEAKSRRKRGLHDTEHRNKSTNLGHSSTLSKQYDHKTVDDSWRCVFCHQHPHSRCMGDLFGPYWVPAHCLKTELNEKKPKSKRKSLTSEVDKEDRSEAEIWFHEDCFVWVPGVYLLGSRIMGMEDAVSLCSNTKCSSCGEYGASLGCTRPGCRNAVHIPCSYDQYWDTDATSFRATCPKCNEE